MIPEERYVMVKIPGIRRLSSVLVLVCLLLTGGGTALRAAPRFEQETLLSLGGQFGDLEHRRLSVDPTGRVTDTKVTLRDLFTTARLRHDHRITNDLGDRMVLDVHGRWDLDLFDRQLIDFERYDRVGGREEVRLGYAQSDATIWALRAFAGLDQEETLPRLDAATVGGELALDRTLGDHVFATLRGGAASTVMRADRSWDHDETWVRATYMNLAPERYTVDPLPAHPRSYKADRDLFFELSDELRLWESRPPLLRDGKAPRILDLIPPVPPPPTEDLRIDTSLRESLVGVGAGVTRRDYVRMTDQGYLRADAEVFARWDLGGALALTFQDRAGWQNYDREDESRLLFDHYDNYFALALSHSRPRQHLRLGSSLRTVAFDLADEWSYNVSRLEGSWDYKDHGRYSYAVRTHYQRDMPHDERPGNTYTKEFGVRGTFGIHLTDRRRVLLSFARERETVTRVQSEFDSSYIQDTWDARYRTRMTDDLTWEAGFTLASERHEIFFQNNRDEAVGFVNLLVHL